MSVAQHRAVAMDEEKNREAHVQQYQPDAAIQLERCSRGGLGSARLGGGFDGGCWTSVRNPTAAHLDEAMKHRRMAADHRAASTALQDAEAHACVGLSPDDRDMSPFEHHDDIASVQPLFGGGVYGSNATIEGAVIVLRAVPGMTAQWLQRVIDCHLARNAALGHDVPEMADCPLVPKGVSARVAPTDTGFAVEVRSEDRDTAREVLRRAKSLVHDNAREPPTTAR